MAAQGGHTEAVSRLIKAKGRDTRKGAGNDPVPLSSPPRPAVTLSFSLSSAGVYFSVYFVSRTARVGRLSLGFCVISRFKCCCQMNTAFRSWGPGSRV
eukprot:76963-Rhodomonas_salina.3